MVARENYGKDLDVEVKRAPQAKKPILVYEESVGVDFDSSLDPTSFYGY